MGRPEDIIKFLKKQSRPMRRQEIAIAVDKTPIKVSMILQRLVKHHEVKFVEVNHEEALEKYGCKRRMRLYYVDATCC